MTFYGITASKLEAIAKALDLRLSNVKTVGRGVSVKLGVPHSDHRYARKTQSGKRGPYASYEAFRDFTLSAFENGASKVRTITPSHNRQTLTHAEFYGMLHEYRYMNIGSQMNPVSVGLLSNESMPVTVAMVEDA